MRIPITAHVSQISISSVRSHGYVIALANLISTVDTPPLLSGSPGNRTCVLCPPGTWADQSGFSCAACGLDNCSQCLEPYNGRCFPSPSSLPSPPSSPPPFTYYTQHFTEGVGLCRQGNQEACQLLINLCVLQRYSRSEYNTSSAVQ